MKLTDKEFETIIEALDHLPSMKTDGRLMSRLLMNVICKDEESKQRMESELKVKEAEEDANIKELKTITNIIKGKLCMMQNEIVEGPVAYHEGEPTETVE